MSAVGAYHGAAVAVSNGSWLTLQGSADPTDSLVACNTVLKTPENNGDLARAPMYSRGSGLVFGRLVPKYLHGGR